MRDPRYLVPCPICNSTGRTGTDCPYPPDVEVDCSECIYSGECGSDPCRACDGEGQMDEYSRRELLETLGKYDIHEHL